MADASPHQSVQLNDRGFAEAAPAPATQLCPMCGPVYQTGTKACAACGEDLRVPVIANDRPPTWGDILMTLAVIMGVHAVMVVIVFALMGAIR